MARNSGRAGVQEEPGCALSHLDLATIPAIDLHSILYHAGVVDGDLRRADALLEDVRRQKSNDRIAHQRNSPNL